MPQRAAPSMESPMRLIFAMAAVLLAGTPALAETFPSSAGNLAVDTVAGGLVNPWSLAFLPDGRMLVTERPGRMRIVTRGGELSPPIAGVPSVYAQSQAGLMDVILARDYAQSRTIFFCYAEHYEGGGRIAVARARLEDGRAPRLVGSEVIFRQQGPADHGLNIGCRMVQAEDGNLFVTLGDHFYDAKLAQTLDNHIGKIVRITPEGKAPPDNPFVGKAGALPEIWAYWPAQCGRPRLQPGQRRIVGAGAWAEGWRRDQHRAQGRQLRLAGGELWRQLRRHAGRHRQGARRRHGRSVWHWTPSIAPSGMAFYTGDLIPGWKGSLINGALKFELIARLALDGDKVTKEERLLQGLHERIRDVRQGPDGALYLLTDNAAGRILRVAPAK